MNESEIEIVIRRLGPELERRGGILDRIDYREIRRLGVILCYFRHIPPGCNRDGMADYPPVLLKKWVECYDASLKVIDLAQSSGLLPLLQDSSDKIQAALSADSLPSIDALIVDKPTLEQMVVAAKISPRVKRFNHEQDGSCMPTVGDLAEQLKLNFDDPGPVPKKRVDAATAASRWEIGTLIGKVAVGGALAVANISLGVSVAILPPGDCKMAVELANSVFTGISSSLDALAKLSAKLKKRSSCTGHETVRLQKSSGPVQGGLR